MKRTADLDVQGHKVIVILSSDTEFDPPSRGGTWKTRSTKSFHDGLPRFLELCDRYKIRSTLFCEAKLVQELPGLFRELAKTHEIGCHSYAHEWLGRKFPPKWIPVREEFEVLSDEAKKKLLQTAADAIADIIGSRPVSFKAPFNSIDDPSTLQVMARTGFKVDSSLPCYDSESFLHPLNSAPTRHVSENNLWRPGGMNLIEVPFMIRPRPLFWHPFDIREEIVDTVDRGMKLALESVEIQCRTDHLLGEKFSMIHITSHPWEFSEIKPWGGRGKANEGRLSRYIEELLSRYEVEFLAVNSFAEKWENEYCSVHSPGPRRRE
jgi:peptidoglycan/xylan/chitin deacetylase (PgdA/CDA1 family)